MSVDIRTILLVILIIGIVVGVTFFAFSILNEPSNVQYSNISKNTTTVENIVQNTITENIVEDTNEIVENEVIEDISSSSDDLTSFYGTGLYINNQDPVTDTEDYVNINYILPGGGKVSYFVPDLWERSTVKCTDPLSESELEASNSITKSFIDEVYNETTYEEVLDAFVEREKSNLENANEFSVSRRILEAGDNSFPVIVMRDNSQVISYIVFINGIYEYHLKIVCPSKEYNSEMINTIDNIFKSFKIS